LKLDQYSLIHASSNAFDLMHDTCNSTGEVLQQILDVTYLIY